MWALNHAFLRAHNKPMWGKLLHTAHRSFYTDLCTHRRNCNFTSVFGDRTSFRAKGLRRKTWKSQFDLSFWRSNLISCERVATGTRKSQFYCTSVFDDRTSFRAKGLRGTHELAILSQFWAIQPHFVRKGCAGRLELAILPQFLTIEPHFVRKGCAGRLELAILPQFLAIEPHFVRKGCAGQLEIAI